MTPETSFVEAIADAVVERLKKDGVVLNVSSYPKLMSVSDAAKYMDRSVSNVRKLIARGRIPKHTVRRLGGRIMIVKSEFDAWMESGK